jgi:prophage regulatory protein
MSNTELKQTLPSTGFIRLPNIIGNPKSNPPIIPLIPVSSSSWWNGIKKGIYPKPFKIGPNTTAWRVEDIRKLIEKLGGEQ